MGKMIPCLFVGLLYFFVYNALKRPRALPWANEKLHLHSEARSKHDIQHNHTINIMVATTPWVFRRMVFVGCFVRQRTFLPMVWIFVCVNGLKAQWSP